MAHGSRLMAHAARLVAQGSWLMAKIKLALGTPGPGPSAKFYFKVSKLQSFEVPSFQFSKLQKFQVSTCSTFDILIFKQIPWKMIWDSHVFVEVILQKIREPKSNH